MANLLIYIETALLNAGFIHVFNSQTTNQIVFLSSIHDFEKLSLATIDLILIEELDNPATLRNLSEYIRRNNPQIKILLLIPFTKLPVNNYRFRYHVDYVINQQIEIENLLRLLPILIDKPPIPVHSLPCTVKLSLFENTIIYYVKVQYSNKLIALELDVTERTIERHLQKIYLKFNVTNKSALTKLLNSIEII